MQLIQGWFRDYINFDKIGIGLSVICTIHCLITPLVLLSLPIMTRYYLLHPYFHLLMALFIIPVALYAFWAGFKHHRNKRVFVFGLPGLVLVAIVPLLVHDLKLALNEPVLVTFGSVLLIYAHWINRKSCSCELHRNA